MLMGISEEGQKTIARRGKRKNRVTISTVHGCSVLRPGLVASGTHLIGTTDSQPISGSASGAGTKAPSTPLPMTAHHRPPPPATALCPPMTAHDRVFCCSLLPQHNPFSEPCGHISPARLPLFSHLFSSSHPKHSPFRHLSPSPPSGANEGPKKKKKVLPTTHRALPLFLLHSLFLTSLLFPSPVLPPTCQSATRAKQESASDPTPDHFAFRPPDLRTQRTALPHTLPLDSFPSYHHSAVIHHQLTIAIPHISIKTILPSAPSLTPPSHSRPHKHRLAPSRLLLPPPCRPSARRP